MITRSELWWPGKQTRYERPMPIVQNCRSDDSLWHKTDASVALQSGDEVMGASCMTSFCILIWFYKVISSDLKVSKFWSCSSKIFIYRSKFKAVDKELDNNIYTSYSLVVTLSFLSWKPAVFFRGLIIAPLYSTLFVLKATLINEKSWIKELQGVYSEIPAITNLYRRKRRKPLFLLITTIVKVQNVDSLTCWLSINHSIYM